IWKIRKEKKFGKLLQFAERVWHITEGTDEERIDLAIEKTTQFFQSLGVKTKLSDYGVRSEDMDKIIASLEKGGRTHLSETEDMTLDVTRKVLETAL
ncbi:MAG: NADH-dependent alcohol dehydrogenase, partial [Fusobacteriaceae bacterium]